MSEASTALRTGVLAILLLGTLGAGVELILLEHYEDAWQYLPLVLFAAAIVTFVWNLFAANAASVRVLRLLMALYVAAGLLGVGLHFRGAAEFQTEIDPNQGRWALINKSLHSKAPPVLAPGLMVQIGLLGLISTYRHPALARAGTAVER